MIHPCTRSAFSLFRVIMVLGGWEWCLVFSFLHGLDSRQRHTDNSVFMHLSHLRDLVVVQITWETNCTHKSPCWKFNFSRCLKTIFQVFPCQLRAGLSSPSVSFHLELSDEIFWGFHFENVIDRIQNNAVDGSARVCVYTIFDGLILPLFNYNTGWYYKFVFN